MAKNSYRRQVSGKTSKDDPISIPRVSSNGNAVANARAKGCFGWSDKIRQIPSAVKSGRSKKKQG